MEGDRHFSHPHPLISFLDDKEVDETDNYHSCKLCGLPILSAPSFTCTISACDFFLHESCPNKFPEKFIHPSHVRPHDMYGLDGLVHTLSLREGSPNFTYKCEIERCNFKMHPLAAVAGVEIKSKHISHPPHPLVVHCREVLSLCDACGVMQLGFFFWCQQCNFWIHQDCLPSHHPPFLLVYSLPVATRLKPCIVCNKPLKFTHARCGLDKTQSKTRLELIQLPDDELGTFPSLELRTYSQRNQADGIGDEEEKLPIENFHKHPLILVGDEEEEEVHNYKQRLVCDICIQTITIPSQFYRCVASQQGFSFLAHKVCADLLPITKFENPFHIEARPCLDPAIWFFNSIFYCSFCCLPCNGPCYYFTEFSLPYIDYDIPWMIDLSCMAAPSITKHTSHGQHILFRTSHRSQASRISCCSRKSIVFYVYKCIVCNFYIPYYQKGFIFVNSINILSI